MSGRSTLREYVQVLRRRKWIFLQAVVVVTALSVALSMLQQPRYEASAEVLLSRQNLANSLNNVIDPTLTLDPQRLVQTQVSVAQIPQIAANTLKAANVHDRTTAQFLAASHVSAQADADLIDFSVTDRHPALAASLATTYANEYVTYANGLATRSLRSARADVEAKIADLQASGQGKRALYDSLVSKDEQLATMEALQTGNAVFLKPAEAATQVQPRPVRNGLLGLLVGVVLGLAMAFLRDHFDTRVRSAREISDQLGLPMLARLPEPPRDVRRKNRLVMIEHPTSHHAEPFRVLVTNLEFVTHEEPPKTIMVTSAREGEGKSTTAANLAVALARTGRRVALIDLDLRRPSVHEFFQIPSRPGLTDFVLGHAELDQALVQVPLPALEQERARKASEGGVRPFQGDLEVMCSGPLPPNPGDFIRSRGIALTLRQLGEIFDTVVVDSAPLIGLGDSLALIPRVDALVLVARLELLRRPMIGELRRVLESSPARPLGIVVTAAEREGGYGYGYGYDYNHGYGYGNANNNGSEHAFGQNSNGRPLPVLAPGPSAEPS